MEWMKAYQAINRFRRKIESKENKSAPEAVKPELPKCQECGSTDFIEGPHGGEAVNFACAKCFARYNDLWPFTIMRHGYLSESDKIHWNTSGYLYGARPYRPRGPIPAKEKE